MAVTPFSPEIVEILQVMIAPNKHMRLSPMVEETQLRVLWGESVNLRRRYESIRTIIANHEDDIRRLAEVQVDSFQTNRYSIEWYEKEDFRRMWLVHNFPVNVCKVQIGLLELVKAQKLVSEISVIDIGVGAGNAPIALFDFLIAWSFACMLYDLEMPIIDVKYAGYDYIEGWLHITEKVINSYQQILQEHIQRLGSHHQASEVLKRVVKWMEQCDLQRLNLEEALPQAPSRPTLLIACNLLSELKDASRCNLMKLMDALPTNSCALIIEPGDKERSQRLFGWRREFLRQYRNWSILAPCGQEYGRELPECCRSCWNLRRDSFHETQLYRKFREVANEIRLQRGISPDKRSWEEYDNYLLSQSYTILIKGEIPCLQEPLKLRQENGRIRGRTRYVGHYAKDGSEFLKLCPASAKGIHSLMLERRVGVEIPCLNYGDVIEVECSGQYDDTNRRRGEIILRMADDVEEPVRLVGLLPDRPSLKFLPNYTERTRAAIDAIAYRLFGFEKMYDFQHDVLSYVLCGKSILAIAATGGGKSECFILPALLLPGITIVVSPLKSLMQDQYEQRLTERYGFGSLATYINSDVPFQEREARLRRLEKGYYKIVYFTPEQLERDYVLAAIRRAHERVGVRYIALDEAHCISQWGHDFRPAYLNMVHRLQNAGIEPLPVRIALTATASPKVREDVCRELRLNPKPTSDGGDLYVHSSNRPELNFIVKVFNNTDEKVDDMIRRLRKLDPQRDAAIVFLPHTGGDPNQIDFSRHGPNWGRLSSRVTSFASYLERQLGMRVCIYHSKMEDASQSVVSELQEAEESEETNRDLGDLRGRLRRREQDRFIRGERHIMVATKGFGMGIDKPNIRLVLHRTPPANLEAYIQEAGRAGRDGDFADVVLYYSSDTPPEESERDLARSDREIQEFFISEKYIRREDVQMMCAFLKQLTRKINNAFYFTNDEVVEFFEQNGFQWPKFPERKKYSKETKEHQVILDRGYEYESKKAYINRILSAMYSFRPEGRALLNRVQQVGIKIIKPQVLRPNEIVNSNAYFGRKFRDAGISADELRQLIEQAEGEEGIIPLAKRLRTSLYETQSMLWDIRMADGRVVDGTWKPALLDFKGIVAPRYGPAAGRNTLSEWRDYAGAVRRASKVERLTSVGWEVELGDVFSSDEELERAIEAFIMEHDQRKQDDWNAYHYMLNDYVGIRSEGKKNCLRAVMLGYLKTNEVIVGDNCYSCSRCVPDENFSRDMQQRRKVIQLLRQDIIDIINDIEQNYANTFVEEDTLNRLWELTESEQRQGRNVHAYLKGWSERVLVDTPEHKTVRLIRLDAMYRGYWELLTSEYVQHLKRLFNICSQEELQRVALYFHHIRQLEPDDPDVLQVMAEFYRKQGDSQRELEELQLLVQKKPAYDLFERILQLYAELNIHDVETLQQYRQECARYAPDANRSLQLYALTPIVDRYDRVIEECIYLLDSKHPHPHAKATQLMNYYLDRGVQLTNDELFDLGDRWFRIRRNYDAIRQEQAIQPLDRAIREKIAALFVNRIGDMDARQQLRAFRLIEKYEVDDQLLKMLEAAANSSDESIRFYICKAAARYGDRGVKLLQPVISDSRDHIRMQGYETLVKIGTEQALEMLEQGLNDPNEAHRLRVVEMLSRFARLDAIVRALQDKATAVRESAYNYIVSSKASDRNKYLQNALFIDDERIQQHALCELISNGEDEIISEAITAPDFRYAREALLYLGYKGHTRGVERALNHPSASIRRLACWLLLRLAPEQSEHYLGILVKDPDVSVRRFACLCAARYRVVSILKICLWDKTFSIRRIAASGVVKLMERKRLSPVLLLAKLIINLEKIKHKFILFK